MIAATETIKVSKRIPVAGRKMRVTTKIVMGRTTTEQNRAKT